MGMGNSRNFPRRFQDRSGFTLIELIVVITIIGILGTMVVLRVSGIPSKAAETKTRSDLKTIIGAAEIFRAQFGRYPETLEELKGARTPEGKPEEPLLRETKDFWRNEYIYEIGPDGGPRARCLGKDNAEGGQGENQDYEEPALQSQ